MILKTFDEMCDDESICEYCEATPGVFGTPNGYTSCEGAWCENAYGDYLDNFGATDKLVKYQNSVQLLNKEVLG